MILTSAFLSVLLHKVSDIRSTLPRSAIFSIDYIHSTNRRRSTLRRQIPHRWQTQKERGARCRVIRTHNQPCYGDIRYHKSRAVTGQNPAMNTSDDVSQSALNPGVYLNMFEVLVSPFVTRLHTAPRSRLPDLRDLRKACEANGQDVHVHAVDSMVYGYGTDRTVLEAHGFVGITYRAVTTHPKLVGSSY